MSERDFDVAGALASLRTAVRDSVSAPTAAVLRERAEQRRRSRRLSTAAMAAVAVVAVVLAVGTVVRGDLAAPLPPAGSPTGSLTPRPDRPVPTYPDNRVDGPITQVDWADVTLTVPPRGPDCPSGELRFTGGRTNGYPRMELILSQPRPPAFGDLTGDGQAEAVLEAICARDAEADHQPSQLLVVTRESSGALRPLGWVGPQGWGVVLGFWTAGGRLVVEPDLYSPGETIEYRWAGDRFERLDTGWPGIEFTDNRPAPPIDLGPDGGRVARSLGCPGGVVRLRQDQVAGRAVVGDFAYFFDQPVTVAHVLDLAGDGHRYVVVQVGCDRLDRAAPPSGGGGASPGYRRGVMVLDYDRAAGRFRAVDLVPVPANHTLTQWTFDRGRLTVGLARVEDGTEAPSQRWRWNGSYFQREG
jgi:hypothetical protein